MSLTNNRKSYFLEKIRRYAEEYTQKGLPINANLIYCILHTFFVLERFGRQCISFAWRYPEPVKYVISSENNEVIARFNESLSQLDIPRLRGFKIS